MMHCWVIIELNVGLINSVKMVARVMTRVMDKDGLCPVCSQERIDSEIYFNEIQPFYIDFSKTIAIVWGPILTEIKVKSCG